MIRWTPFVERWHTDHPKIDPALVLAIIAQESMGEEDVVGGDRVGSVGLMQIAPFEWRTSASELKNPSVNISWGMAILDSVMEDNPGDLRRSLAVYNCGERGVRRDYCGRHGGYAYADVVLDYWLPVFREALNELANGGFPDMAEWMESFYPNRSVQGWLASLGYDTGYGNWEVIHEEEDVEESCVVLPARRFRPRICL